MSGWLYVLASKANGTIYTGVTNDLVRRVYEHREHAVAGFTKTYDVARLVFFEEHGTMPLAIQREKNIKHWPRRWKVDLIESVNPAWEDLWDQITL